MHETRLPTPLVDAQIIIARPVSADVTSTRGDFGPNRLRPWAHTWASTYPGTGSRRSALVAH